MLHHSHDLFPLSRPSWSRGRVKEFLYPPPTMVTLPEIDDAADIWTRKIHKIQGAKSWYCGGTSADVRMASSRFAFSARDGWLGR